LEFEMTERIGTSTFNALRQLANRWTLKAREFARDAKSSEKGEANAAYNRGLAEGYYKAAVELAEVLKQQAEGIYQTQPAQPVVQPASPPQPAPRPKPAAAPVPPAETYLPLSLNEVLLILEYAGTNARDVSANKHNVFTAVFSKWENLMPHERIEKLKKADMRLIVLNSGKTKDSSDPFVEFAFKAMNGAS
jgi:hypothetical protein